jgi:tetratricopeptide (TPR) repeat protein/serine/threonine protein kinase
MCFAAAWRTEGRPDSRTFEACGRGVLRNGWTMTSANEESVFAKALEIQEPDQRAAYLDQACAGSPGLRKNVESLLSAYDAGQFLEAPAPAPIVTVDEPVREGPGTVIGPYKLLEQIGEGGFGVVFMAEQQQPVRRKVALKVLKPGMDTRQVVARFEAERQALALMDHPHIAHVFDGGATAAGRPYFVMELVRGIPVTDFCDQNRLPVRERLELLVGVCQAVQHAHHKGVIHRDLKPSNVLVTLQDGAALVKVIDFGIAKALGQSLTDKTLFTGFAQLIGTPLYMAPEQAALSNVDVDTRSDIYSLGVLLYELLTGTTPFTKERLQEAGYDELRRIIREEEPPRPSTRLSTLGQAATTISTQRRSDPKRLSQLFRGELDWIVMKALDKDRNRRYETASAFAADVQRYLHDEPVLACPPSALYRFGKFARRNKVGLAIAGLILLLLVVFGSGLGWFIRDRAARRAGLEQGVVRALDETENACQRDRSPEASAALKRAEHLVDSGECSEVLRERVRQWRADLDLVGRLQEARMVALQVNLTGGRSQMELRLSEYEAAFRHYGLDPASVRAEQAAERIRSRPAKIQTAVFAALDYWFLAGNLYAKKPSDNPQKQAWLKKVLRLVDSDPWRMRFREAGQRKDAKALADLAASPNLVKQPPAILFTLGVVLGNRELGLAVLRRAQQLYPGDYWINHTLGYKLGPGQMDDEIKPADQAEALRFLSIAVALQPEYPGALLNLGVVHRKLGNLKEAIALFRRALTLKPDYADCLNDLGIALKDQGKLDAAIAAYRRAIKWKPKYAHAHCNLGYALQSQGKLKEAIQEYRKAIDCDRKHVWAHHHLGTALQSQGKLDKAIKEYRKAVKYNPNYAWAHTGLGVALADQGKLNEAITAHRKALALNPKLAMAHYNLGLALQAQGKLGAAAARYRRAINLKPGYSLAHNNLGNTLRSLGRLDQAIREFRKAIASDPKFALAHTNLGLALDDQGKLDEAITEHRKAIALKPDCAPAYLNLGKALGKQGKLGQAITASRKAIQLQPGLWEAHANLGTGFCSQGKLEEGIAAYRKAIALKPNWAEGHILLGAALYKKGNLPGAIKAFRRATALDPQKASAHGALGEVLLLQGHFAEGRDATRRYLDLLPADHSGRAFASRQLRRCERLLALDKKLPAVLQGKAKPANAAEGLELAWLCQQPYKRFYAATARFYADGFAAQSGLADNLGAGHRYNAACAAALAGVGEGKDATSLTEMERKRLRRQSVHWLRADLKEHGRALENATPGVRRATVQALQHWLRDPDLRGVREDAHLKKLPPEERDACVKLWRNVREMLKRAQSNK